MSNKYESYSITLDLGQDITSQIHITSEDRMRLSITVHPDLRITVKAPASKTRDEIIEHIRKRKKWIITQLNYFEKFHPIQPERKYVSGETHYYLGRQYRLKIIKGEKRQAKLKGKYFNIEIPFDADKTVVKDILWGWYRSHAIKIFNERIAIYMGYFKRFDVDSPSFQIRRMKKRWGSCPDGKKLLLNTELIKAPKYCIDYVIVHELCHLIYPRHNNKFFSLLSRILPDWIERKDKLENVII